MYSFQEKQAELRDEVQKIIQVQAHFCNQSKQVIYLDPKATPIL